jgi:RNA 3'-terminal phosphate cyclase (ATP)
MLELDGRDAGGQLVRTAVTMALVEGRAVEVTDVRGTRPEPGLRPQHVAAVEAAAALSGGDVEGASVGADTLRFDPGDGRVPADDTVEVSVGTAGSLTLLFDVLLPLAVVAEAPFTVTATGGTDVAWSPPFGYLQRVKLPLLAATGWDVTVRLDRRGFYPAGGGRAHLSVAPSRPAPLRLDAPADPRTVRVDAVATESLADAEVADRLARAAADGIAERAPALDVVREVTYAPANSTGAVVVLAATGPDTRAGASALGERGVPSETVAARAVESLAAWLATDAPVDDHLADQLALPVALAGGRVRVPRVTDHLESNVSVLRSFGREVGLETTADGVVLAAPPAGDAGDAGRA